MEEATGGTIEIGSLRVQPNHLTVILSGLVLHGTEPRGESPLLRVNSIELRVHLFTGFRKVLDLAYLAIDAPQVNVIANRDGSTNIPEPKRRTTPSQSPLATVVDLEIGRFRIDNGVLAFSQENTPFAVHGDDVKVILDYNALAARYQGFVRIDKLQLDPKSERPLLAHVQVPLELRRHGLSVTKAEIYTSSSHVLVTASLDNPTAPLIAINAQAKLSLPEMARGLELRIATQGRGAPEIVTADLDARIDQRAHKVAVQKLQVLWGHSHLNAAGTASAANRDTVQFSGDLALAELARLFNLSSPKIAGNLSLNANAGFDHKNEYEITGTIQSSGLAVMEGTVNLSDLSLSTPFQVTPNLISLDALRFNFLGGVLSARISIEEMKRLSAQGDLHDISLANLSSTLAGQSVNYGAIISGRFSAANDDTGSVRSGIRASTRLLISPTSKGIPATGVIDANYDGVSGALAVTDAHINLPASQLKLAGALDKSLSLSLVSRNLNDFLPIVRLGSNGTVATLPVSLRNGEAKVEARVQGALTAPRVSGRAQLANFFMQNRLFEKLSFGFAATPSLVEIQNGDLRRNSMRAEFRGSVGLVKWHPVGRSPFATELTVRDADLGDLMALANNNSKETQGTVQADVHIGGTYGNPLGSINTQVSKGVFLGQPFDRFAANITSAPQLVTVNSLELAIAGGTVSANGSFHHPNDRLTSGHVNLYLQSSQLNLAQVTSLQRKSENVQGSVITTINLAGDLSNNGNESQIRISNLTADFSANGLRFCNQDMGALSAKARTSSGQVIYSVKSNFAGSAIDIEGSTSLAPDYVSKARAVIRTFPVQQALRLAGRSDVPVTGLLSADAAVAGTLRSPDIDAHLQLSNAVLYHEPVNQLTAQVHFRNDLVDLPLLDVKLPAGDINLNGRFDHPNGALNGTLNFHVNTSHFDIGKVKEIQQEEPGLGGILQVAGNGSASLRNAGLSPQVRLLELDADINGAGLHLADRKLGTFNLSARTQQANLTFRLDSDIAQMELHASGTSQLKADYVSRANLSFRNVRYSNLAPLIDRDSQSQPPIDALAEGSVSLNGPILNPVLLSGRLELSLLTLSSLARGASTSKIIRVENDQPIVAVLNKQTVNLQKLTLRGDKTYLNAIANLDMADTRKTVRGTLDGTVDLGILQEVDRNFFSSGTLALNANVGGTLQQPLINGKISLQNANINYANAPNGLSSANGIILLTGTNATIQSLTGESGGGKIEVSGDVGLGPTAAIYNLRARAAHVRTRYDNASLTSSARFTLTGNSGRSLLSGAVTVERIAYSSSSDIGSLLYNASVPPSVPTATSPFLAGMRLAIAITTASDLRVSTSFVEKIDVNSSLTVRGTAAQPGVVGHINITDGQLVFFGNTYAVNNGSINFFDASQIRPELNLSLETVAQGVDVTLGVTGPISNMKLSYRSDPPLTFEQIVQLLATNTTPFDPTIAAHQPDAPQQSLSQVGESQVLGQAIANPLASRVQRVFGLSQFKIDPSIAGNNGQPTAKVTLSQKISNNLTFTYITDVTQTNSEIVRVQWDLSAKTSAVALRDYNGNVSVQLFYKFQIR